MSVTNPEDIINNSTTLIDELEEIILSLNSDAIVFSLDYEEYMKHNIYDASLLKKRMKDAVIRAVKNDIW